MVDDLVGQTLVDGRPETLALRPLGPPHVLGDQTVTTAATLAGDELITSRAGRPEALALSPGNDRLVIAHSLGLLVIATGDGGPLAVALSPLGDPPALRRSCGGSARVGRNWIRPMASWNHRNSSSFPRILTGSGRRTIRSGEPSRRIHSTPTSCSRNGTRRPHPSTRSGQEIAVGFWNAAGSLIATAAPDGTFSIRDGETFEVIRTIAGSGRVSSFSYTAFSPDDAVLLTHVDGH